MHRDKDHDGLSTKGLKVEIPHFDEICFSVKVPFYVFQVILSLQTTDCTIKGKHSINRRIFNF